MSDVIGRFGKAGELLSPVGALAVSSTRKSKRARKSARQTISELRKLRQPERRVLTGDRRGEIGLQRRQAVARGRQSTRFVWETPSGELKSVLGG